MDYNDINQVSIVDIKMPFWSMVAFMVKATLASIPALIIVAIIYFSFAALLIVLGDMPS